jgi:hypothetical protein
MLITSIIFIFAALFFVDATAAFLLKNMYFLERLADIETDGTFFVGIKVVVFLVTIELLGIFLGLKFMWDVRHHKIE